MNKLEIEKIMKTEIKKYSDIIADSNEELIKALNPNKELLIKQLSQVVIEALDNINKKVNTLHQQVHILKDRIEKIEDSSKDNGLVIKTSHKNNNII